MSSWLCLLPLLSSFLDQCVETTPLAVGYVEGDYVLIAPIDVSQIVTHAVRRGERVEPDQTLSRLEQRDAEIRVAESTAALAHSLSQLDDLSLGKRDQELAMIEASLNSARAEAKDANKSLERETDLYRRGLGTQAAVDRVTTQLAVTRARVTELEATLALARLPARQNAIRAAEAVVTQAEAALESARWRLQQRTLKAPAAGIITDILRQPGEIAGPQAPVFSMLPDNAIRLRLYVSSSDYSRIGIGSQLQVQCDGCTDAMTATVNYISSDPEFTPPVIYSLENRQKLVYLIEAIPDSSATALKPGQIVDAQLPRDSP